MIWWIAAVVVSAVTAGAVAWTWAGLEPGGRWWCRAIAAAILAVPAVALITCAAAGVAVAVAVLA